MPVSVRFKNTVGCPDQAEIIQDATAQNDGVMTKEQAAVLAALVAAGSILPRSVGLLAGAQPTPDTTIHISQTTNLLMLAGDVTTTTIDVSGMPQVDGQPWSGLAVFVVFNNHTWSTGGGGNIASPAIAVSGAAGPKLVIGYYDHGQGRWYFM